MRIPVIKGVIDRRILVNFRVDPNALNPLLPAPFRPKLQDGHAIAGICLIRLRDIRPRFMPAALGISSENAAHRIAVEWDGPDGAREGVFIPRRDSSSRLNTLLGGKLFPGEHHHASFNCREESDRYEIAMSSDDKKSSLRVNGAVAATLPESSVFRTLSDASRFFERGSLGYSVTKNETRFDGLELRSFNWKVEPLRVDDVASSFFQDSARFPPGSVEFDCALLMRNVEHEWHGRESLCCAAGHRHQPDSCRIA